MKLQLPNQFIRSEECERINEMKKLTERWRQLRVDLEFANVSPVKRQWSLEQAKYLYDKQLARDQAIEGKINRMFSVLSVSVALVGFLFIQLPLHLVHLSTQTWAYKFMGNGWPFDVLEAICGLGFFYNLISALYMLFQSAKLRQSQLPDEEYLTIGDESSASLQILKDIVFSSLANQIQINFKGALVVYTLRYIGWTLGWFVLTVILEFILKGLGI